MRCPFCNHLETAVKDSRCVEDNACIRRRRHCLECSARFTTIERVQLLPLQVIKKNGKIDPFDRDKLSKSVHLALHKRPIDSDRIDKVINSLVRQLEARGETDIPSTTIGEMVMAALKDMDSVAYIRFASIYRDFHLARDFQDAIQDVDKT